MARNFRHHPDGIIFIVDDAEEYQATIEEFGSDITVLGLTTYPALPSDITGRFYNSERHILTDDSTQVGEVMPWILGEEYITALPELLNQKLARETAALDDPLDLKRVEVHDAVRTEGIKRISAQVPAWDSLETVQLVVSIANMLNAGAMTTTQNNARLTYLYVRDTALPKLNTLTLAELEQVDPPEAQPFLAVDNTDGGWPV